MLTLPISLVTSLAFVWLVLVRVKRNDWRVDELAILVLMIAAQGGIIALAQHWGIAAFLWIQPVTALLVPPIAWLACQGNLRRPLMAIDSAHVALPLVGLVLAPTPLRWMFDALVPVVFAGYGIAILLVLRSAHSDLPRARLASVPALRRLWRIISLALLMSAFNDVLILAAQILGQSRLQPWIVSAMSTAMLAALGGIGLLPEPAPLDQSHDMAASGTEEDAELFDRLTAHMSAKRPYLDPDLTLERLARQIRVPAKQLSAAINRQTGENVSRYVNALRIDAAARALSGGASVTQAMLDSGFNTKSNFNREFLRVKGQTPSAWRQAQSAA